MLVIYMLDSISNVFLQQIIEIDNMGFSRKVVTPLVTCVCVLRGGGRVYGEGI